MTLIIDSHAHIYSYDEVSYPTIQDPYRPPKTGAPGGTGSIEHLRAEMEAAGVARALAIQTSTFYRWENRFLVDSARANAGWMAGICTLDPEDPDSPALLENYLSEYNCRGMRLVPTASAPHRLDHPGARALFAVAREHRATINALVSPEFAGELGALLEAFPDVNVVLDHCMNPPVEEGPEGRAIQAALRLARFPNLHAKVTFLPTSSKTGYPCDDTHELARAVIQAYGPDRCVWGSDFPCELWCPNVTYAEHLEIFKTALELTAAEQEAILSATAARLWFHDVS